MPNAANYHVQLNDFIRCCGAFILNTFDTKYTPKDLQDYHRTIDPYGTEKEFKDYVTRNCETPEEYRTRLTKEIQKYIDNYKNRKSYFIAITNKDEKNDGAEEILKDLGFEICIPETKNPTGTSITMWVYHLLPREKKVTKSIFKKGA